MHNVIPISKISNLQIIQLTAVFVDGEHISHNLTGMIVISETVYNRDRGVFSQLKDMLMLEQSSHNDIIVATQYPSDVANGLSLANADIIGPKIEGMSTQSKESCLEGYPGSGRWFREDHGQREVVERPVITSFFELGFDSPGQIENLPHLICGQISDMEEVLLHSALLISNQSTFIGINLLAGASQALENITA
jgi:hypothetical protein